MDDASTGIRFGLSTVKNVGEGAVRSIIEARETLPEQRFGSFEEFCDTVEWSLVNKRVAESLIKCGALDELGNRGALLEALEPGINAAQSRQKAAKRGQVDMFSALQVETPAIAMPALEEVTLPAKTLLTWEKELLGFYLSSHPLNDLMPMIRDGGFVQLAEIDEETVGEQIDCIVLLAGIRRITTKKNRTMAICEFEDQSGSIEAVLFPDVYEASTDLLQEDAVVRVSARVDNRNDRVQLIVTNVKRMSTEKPVPVQVREIHLYLVASPDVEDDIRRMHRIRELFDEFPGDDRLILHVSAGNVKTELVAGMGVDWCDDVAAALAELVGAESFNLREREEFRQPSAELLSA